MQYEIKTKDILEIKGSEIKGRKYKELGYTKNFTRKGSANASKWIEVP